MRRAFVLATLGLLLCALPASAASNKNTKPIGKHHTPIFLMPGGWPRTISIPEIKVNAKIEHLALTTQKGILEAPFEWGDVAWYSLSARPGNVGHAIMFGHLDSTCCPAVFWNLKKLKVGQRIWIHYKSKTLHFRIMWVKEYPNTHLPTKFMYGRTTQRGLILYTCAGVFHYDGSGYDHKTFVYARLVLPNGRLG